MEIHRLKPMKDYDSGTFNKIYKETEDLRTYLTNSIDARRFGVSSDIIKSYFDDKFIFVFNRYYGTMSDERLKGYIINSLKTFKLRMLRFVYQKSNMFNDSISIGENEYLINIIPDNNLSEEFEELLSLAKKFMKKRLSIDAALLFEIELNPPPYICYQMKSANTKIPAKLIAEYLDLEESQGSIDYINSLRKEINKTIGQAKEFFKTHPTI